MLEHKRKLPQYYSDLNGIVWLDKLEVCLRLFLSGVLLMNLPGFDLKRFNYFIDSCIFISDNVYKINSRRKISTG
ncbi:MAG: hypothetical protein FD170_984 [Bacteroidetes bacterium]|nr:MAG: hypothetical protein FD170_984 [Bacteroidota bacterium]